MKKTILFFIQGAVGTKEQTDMARSIGAQIRNSELVHEVNEKCDYVAGHIPKCYQEHKVFGTAKNMSTFAEGDSNEDDSGEDTALEDMTKNELIAHAEENGIELTKEDRKNKANTLAAILEHSEED